jgi:hypothetical protein
VPGVYTDVRHHVGWLADTMRRVSKEEAKAGSNKTTLDRAGKQLEIKELIRRIFDCHHVRIS